ncbi:DUF2924 domain-containing protein [Lysobacter enzymogenes]|uniref:DUF2924 domain-containing protein n=1 Tax=Lysobacter enzymogenes TaxID=69 RepID=UPI001AF49D11|nr:DUF2924 domain-containing protein [Lysobacter enzymogenes]QQQ01277.1 DUF2924 domain-containing protein [Lysobacter enzymogenes]
MSKITTTFQPSASLLAQLARLPEMSWAELKAEHQRLYHAEPAVKHRRFVERRIATRLQEIEYRQHDRARLDRNQRRIRALVESGEIPPRARNTAPMPGTVLSREFNGALHCVTVGQAGVAEYLGRQYTSLSAVARAITGTRWSGPAFFGLRTTNKKESK